MTLEQTKEVLESRGYEVSETMNLKGSVRVPGLIIGSGQIKPTIYAGTVEEMEDEEQVVNLAERILKNQPQINLSVLLDKDFILEHCVSCIRHATDDETHIKWSVFGDLEEIIKINLGADSLDNQMSITVTQGILNQADISAEELRMHARRNLSEHVSIKSMAEVLSDMLGAMGEEMMVPSPDEMMYVATNDSKINGAAVILLDDILQKFCEEHDLEHIYIIPSSLHEVILVSPCMGEDAVNDMIRDVNATQVDPWDQLSDHVYHFVA